MNINKHPFWKACVGSQLNFILIEPPDSQLKSLHVSIYTVSPKTYKIRIFTSDGQCSSSVHYEKEAISLIKKNWMKYYANKTRVEFVEYHEFDMCPFFRFTAI